MTGTALVLGGTGKTGRRLVPLLVDLGLKVQVASRHPGEPTGATVEPTPFDWDRPETHGPALAGTSAVYLVMPEMVADPTGVVGPFLAQARDAGVERVVHLSAMGVDAAEGSGYWRAEQQVMASGLDWTILRPNWFMQNFSESFFLPGIRQGALAAPSGDAAVSFVHAGDIAAVAAVALTGDGCAGAALPLTGPEALTFGQVADAVGRAVDRPVRHVDVSSEEMAEFIRQAGVPDDYAAVLLGLFEAVRAGWAAPVLDTVERVTGRPPRSFDSYVAETAEAWRH